MPPGCVAGFTGAAAASCLPGQGSDSGVKRGTATMPGGKIAGKTNWDGYGRRVQLTLMPGSECAPIRNPNSEIRSKSEARNPNHSSAPLAARVRRPGTGVPPGFGRIFRASAFGLVSAFGLRASVFQPFVARPVL